jgi:hypothetical protein
MYSHFVFLVNKSKRHVRKRRQGVHPRDRRLVWTCVHTGGGGSIAARQCNRCGLRRRMRPLSRASFKAYQVNPQFTCFTSTEEHKLTSLSGWTTDGNGTFTANTSYSPGMRVPARCWASKNTLVRNWLALVVHKYEYWRKHGCQRLLFVEFLQNTAHEEAGLPR